MHSTLTNLFGANYGDISSFWGLGVGLLGFAVTIFMVWRSKKAAQRAEEAANAAKRTLVHQSVLVDVSAIILKITDIKRLQRAADWPLLPDRYSELRATLIAVRSAHPFLSRDQQTDLQALLSQLAICEDRIEAYLASGKRPPDPAKFNLVLSQQLEKMHALLTNLKLQTQGATTC